MPPHHVVALASLVASASAWAAPPLGAALRQDAGGSPVFFVWSDAGVAARTADGRVDRVLVPGRLLDVQWDPALDVLWVVRAGEGDVVAVDLQGDAAPITVVTGLPRSVVFRPTVTGASDDGALNSHAEVALVITERPRLAPAVVQGVDYEWWYAGGKGAEILKAQARQARRARLAAKPWVTALAKRTRRPSGPGRIEPGVGPRVVLPEGRGACEDPEVCGQSAPFGRWSLVAVSHECGDFCYVGCLVHDAATGRFAKPTATGTWTTGDALSPEPCGDFWLDAGGSQLLAGTCDAEGCDGQLCTLGGACAPLEGRPVGWLDPGAVFVIDRPRGPP